MSFTIEIQDQAVQQALQTLQGRLGDLSPIMQALGEDIVERTKQRFATATDPDGNPWQPNAPATIADYLRRKGGIGKRGINKKGVALAANKRPLQGESGDLARQFSISVTPDSLTVGSGPVYAAIQQFGGQAGRNLGVTIPARPFLPITQGGELYPREHDLIMDMLSRYLTDGKA